jgi:hypothetical protein
MLVTTTGSKLWRFGYRFDDKQKLLAIGQYPIVSLADARAKRDDARKLLAEGIDPSVERKAERRNARIARTWAHRRAAPSERLRSAAEKSRSTSGLNFPCRRPALDMADLLQLSEFDPEGPSQPRPRQNTYVGGPGVERPVTAFKKRSDKTKLFKTAPPAGRKRIRYRARP